MKLICLMLLVTFTSIVCLAGSPDEDPVVAKLKDRYKMGLSPKVEYLVISPYHCKRFTALRGDFKVEDFKSWLYFRMQGQLLFSYLLSGHSHEHHLVILPHEIGRSYENDDGVWFETIREVESGELIIESSLAMDGYPSSNPSDSVSDALVTSYSHCMAVNVYETK